MMLSKSEQILIQTVMSDIIAEVSANIRSQQRSIAETKHIETNIQALRDHLSDPCSCSSAMSLLFKLARTSVNRTRMKSFGILQLLCEILNRHCNHQPLMHHATLLAAILVFRDDSTRTEFAKRGGVEALTFILRTRPQSVIVLRNAAMALRNVVCGSDSNSQHALRAETVQTLCSRLGENVGGLELENELLACLGNIVFASHAARGEILSKNMLVNQIVSKLATYKEDCKLADKAGVILIQLVRHDTSPERASLRTVANTCKTQSCFKSFSLILQNAFDCKNKAVIETYAHLIRLLCISNEFRAGLNKSNCLGQLVKGLDVQVENSSVVISILKTIDTILSGDDKAKQNLYELEHPNGIIQIARAMTKRKADENFIAACCRVLDNAAHGRNTTDEFINSKDWIAKAVVTAMKDFPHSIVIQEYSCLLLMKIAGSSRSHSSKLLAFGIKNLVEAARNIHSRSSSMQMLTGELMRVIADEVSNCGGAGLQALPLAKHVSPYMRFATDGETAVSRCHSIAEYSSTRALIDASKFLQAKREILGMDGFTERKAHL